MKFIKYFCLLLLIFGITLQANAAQSEADLYKNYCPVMQTEKASSFSRGIQKVTGLNLIASNIAKGEIKKAISQFATGKIKISVKTFSATEAAKGIFKSFEIKGKNVKIYNIAISELNIKTVCPFVHLDLQSNPVGLKEPLAINFNAKFSEADLNSILGSKDYQNYFIKIKVDTNELNLIELKRPKVSLKDNKFHFTMGIKVAFLQPFVFNFKSDLKITNNHIKFNNMHIGSNSKIIDLSSLESVINLFNPLLFAQMVLEDNCKILLKSVKITDGNILIDGAVFLSRT